MTVLLTLNDVEPAVRINALLEQEGVETALVSPLASEQLTAALGTIDARRIEIRPFELERFGVMFGLVPRPPDEPEPGADDFDNWWVEAQPGNYMAFHAPWDSGEYDT